MADLANPVAWASALAAALFFAAAVHHIRLAGSLARYINERCPELWDKILWSDAARQRGIYRRNRGGRLDTIILYNRGAKDYPDDSEFRRLLGGARWSAFVCLISFLAAIILFAKATS
jgi:hypothetical protein